ncbi:DUF262 domain-containing protein [Pedobacter immunditicola]|uniref:DUF262 domain-containing protein n=1 Tax=Pedobacter immunditicola TaxID=3133440 RepID=UPI003097779C
MANKINIKQYFEKGIFAVPDYQRGYKWSVKKRNGKSSLEHFLDSLINAKDSNEYFIEAVTVVDEENEEIVLVDGQQRTTSLFLIFTVLEDFDLIKGKLKYYIREDSHKWLNNQISIEQEIIEDQDVQDIFYFKEAIVQIKEATKNLEKNAFLAFIKTKVWLLYNQIPKEKAVNTFIALNGLKAIMKDEELIKSDLLIKSSRIKNLEGLNKEEQFGIEWKVNEDRGRLARNWDKWLYWWNMPDVKNYFGIGNNHSLYYLLVTYYNICSQDTSKSKDFSFNQFKKQFIYSVNSSKHTFEGLRKLQKTFEDLYNNYESHNFLGLILNTSNSKEISLCYFLDTKNTNKYSLEDYAKWSLVGATHLEIINNLLEKNDLGEISTLDISIKKRKAQDALSLVNEKYVYWDEKDVEFSDQRKENTFRFLLLLNLIEDNKLKRKFNFTIWDNRSLEHIYPKSKIGDLNFENDYLDGSIHCIGNLVLLYGRDNSSFGAKEFIDKKNTYFNTSEKFRSRNLLHTISVFAKSEWKEKEIIENKKATITQLSKYYGI